LPFFDSLFTHFDTVFESAFALPHSYLSKGCLLHKSLKRFNILSMSDGYSELMLAPTNRAKCKRSKLGIEVGELKLVTFYTPKGRSHMESSGFKLTHVAPKTMERIVSESESGIESIRGLSDLPEPAKEVAKRIISCVLNKTPVTESDAAFRLAPEKKRKRKPEEEQTSSKAVCN